MLMIGLQNNERKSKVNFLVDETVQLPIGFTMGISFILGSLIGNLIPIDGSLHKIGAKQQSTRVNSSLIKN